MPAGRLTSSKAFNLKLSCQNTGAHPETERTARETKARPQPHLKPHGHSCSPVSPLVWPARSGPRTEEGPATTRVTGPSARKCPSLVSDVLLSHGLLRSTIGARGLNFRVRNGTGCTSPAMVADQRGAFGCKGAGLARCPGGRTAQRVPVQKVARPRLLRVRGEELGLLVQLG